MCPRCKVKVELGLGLKMEVRTAPRSDESRMTKCRGTQTCSIQQEWITGSDQDGSPMDRKCGQRCSWRTSMGKERVGLVHQGGRVV